MYSSHLMSDPMVAPSNLPDVQASKARPLGRLDQKVLADVDLSWVGMKGIEIPVQIQTGFGPLTVVARVDAGVDLLASSQSRGIHMSRLYEALLSELAVRPVSRAQLSRVLDLFLTKHEGLSSAASIHLELNRPEIRSSLLSANHGVRSYPLRINLTRSQSRIQNQSSGPNQNQSQSQSQWQDLCEIECDVVYSSTCPQSLALSRQAVAENFCRDFSSKEQESLTVSQVASWLDSESGMLATPHAQRSLAKLKVQVSSEYEDLAGLELVDLAEEALKTPVQSLVKRIDEQEFARRNGSHPLFCEDAARVLADALCAAKWAMAFEIEVCHMESLHPHNAVAKIRWART